MEAWKRRRSFDSSQHPRMTGRTWLEIARSRFVWISSRIGELRFFSSQWHAGELSPDEEQSVVLRYQEHLAELLPTLPAPMRTFWQSESLHDAVVRSVTGREDRGDLLLELTSGDNERGYRIVRLSYRGVPGDVYRALAARPTDRPWEVLYDEIDVDNGMYIHRLLFWPYAELYVRFTGFDFTVERCSDRSALSIPRIDVRT
jgi:hypothetical protein